MTIFRDDQPYELFTGDQSSILGKRFNLLDKGWVELIDMMPNPKAPGSFNADMAVINAARVSFLGENKGPTADRKLLNFLLKNNHTSPFEQVMMKFRIRAPLIMWWQQVRHRTFHYQHANAQSGRYTPFEENDFHVPGIWRMQSTSNKQGSSGPLQNVELSRIFSEKLESYYQQGYLLYKELLDAGVAKEQARLALPAFSVYYTWVLTVDVHNLMHWFSKRCAQDAQWEIRCYADVMYTEIFKPLMPWTAEAFKTFYGPEMTRFDQPWVEPVIGPEYAR